MTAKLACRPLARAARVIDAVATRCMLTGDSTTERRLRNLAGLVQSEADVLEGVEVHGLPVVEAWYPPGATVGWMVRHDPATRAARRALGYAVPEDTDA